MRPGKVSENVLKRSVLKQVKTKAKEIIYGAGLGENCAVFMFPENEQSLISMHQNTTAGSECASLAIHKAANNLAAAAARPAAVELSLLLPESFEEERLRYIMEKAEQTCQALGIQLAGGSTKVSRAVTVPVATAAGIGRRIFSRIPKARPEQELLRRYPAGFIKEAQAFERWLSVIPEAATAVKSDVCRMHDASEGGIFGALWEFGRISGVGLEIDLKKLPIRQETVEICEFLQLNPYELLSGGSLIMAADNGFDLVEKLAGEGIAAAVVGKATDNNDRVVMNEDERRFLELPKSDEIYKIETD